MDKIKSRSELVESLKDLLAVEVSARKDYVKNIEIFMDQRIVETIKEIKIDEDKHIALLEELIEILLKNS